MSGGELYRRVAFEARDAADDGYGNPVSGDFSERFAMRARIWPQKGGEDVLAARLAGVQPVVIRVRSCVASRQVTPGWRARCTRTGALYNITAVANMDERDRYLDILATTGVAT